MFHVVRNHPRVTDEQIHAFSPLGVATVHEADDKRGAMAAAIKPVSPGSRVCGPALTVALQPGDNLMLHKALDIVEPGEVLVVDGQAWEGGPWGELMTIIAQAKGAAGLVIDGFVRDVSAIRSLGFAAFARGSSVKGTVKESLGLINHPISCGGVVVHAGDLILGDDDGVCVVPSGRAADVLVGAQRRERAEADLRRRFTAGGSVWDDAGLAAVARARGLREESR